MKSLRLFPLVMIPLTLVAASPGRAETVTLHRLVSGAAAKIGGIPPQRLMFSPDKPDLVKKVPADLVAPLYGVITLGPAENPTQVTVLIDDAEGPAPRLFVDANADGDLTDDPAPDWAQKPYKGTDGKEYTMWDGGATVQVRYGAQTLPVRLGLFRYDLSDAARALYKGQPVYYVDSGYEGELTLGSRSYPVMLVDYVSTGDFRGKAGPLSGILLMIDVNGNGVFDPRGEKYDIAQPFNIGGTTYEITERSASGATFGVVKSSRTVPEILPPPDLRPGKKALPFEGKTVDGQTVRFPSDYKGKLVLLTFWASWCPDCRAELPNWISAYETFHNKGVEFLGVSLDKENQGAQLAAFTKAKGMDWPHVYDGKWWGAAVAQLYFVQSIPTSYLIDGDTGEILAGGNDLLGPRLSEALTRALAKRR